MNITCLKDLYRYEGVNSSKILVRLKYLLFIPGFQYSYCLRHSQTASNRLSSLFWNICLRLLMYRYGIQIPPQTHIGDGLMFGHWGTIVINERARIGKNFTISHGCLIGSSQGKSKGFPVIGDNVKMGANSVIVGGGRIGDNVLIAPGAFVNFDVPDNCIVIGNPGKIIQKATSPTAKYIVNPIEDFGKV